MTYLARQLWSELQWVLIPLSAVLKTVGPVSTRASRVAVRVLAAALTCETRGLQQRPERAKLVMTRLCLVLRVVSSTVEV